MKRSRLSVLAIAATAAFAAGPAHAERHYRSGITCQPHDGSQNRIGYSEWGAINYSSVENAEVFCPLEERRNTMTTLRPDSVELWMYDASETEAFSCYVFGTDGSGYSSWTDTKSTCNLYTAAGCNTGITYGTGLRRIQFDYEMGRLYQSAIYGVWCQIPKQANGNRSYLRQLTTIQPPY